MNDELHQLLRRADRGAPPPTVNVTALPERIRLEARHRKQRRVALYGVSIPLILLVCVSRLPTRHSTPPVAEVIPAAPSMSRIDADMHARTAAILEASEKRQRVSIDPSDVFLVNIATERNQTALLLLHDANRMLENADPRSAAATLQRTIALFPGTVAASRAGKQLEQLEARSQS